MVRRNVLVALLGVVLVGFFGVRVYESTRPSKVETIVACLRKLGYVTNVFHDDGTMQQCLFDLCGTVRIRQPRTQVTASVPNGVVLTVIVPDGGGATEKHPSYGVSVPQTARRAAARCAEIA